MAHPSFGMACGLVAEMPPESSVDIPYDPTTAERAQEVITAFEQEGVRVHGLCLGMQAFVSLLSAFQPPGTGTPRA